MLDFSKFSVLTFDCYGTIIDWESGIFSALQPILAAHDRKVDDVTLLQTYSELELEAEQQEPFLSYHEVLASVVRGFGKKLGFTATESEQRSLAESIAHWHPFADSVGALRKLKERFKLVIMSNIDDDLFAQTAPKLEIRFDDVITAQQARCYKPGKSIFELAERRVGVSRERWLHVGQSLYHDVIPAQAIGLATVWVNRPSPRAGAGATKAAKAAPDLEVSSLKQLADAASVFSVTR